MKKTSEKSKLRDSLPNTWLALLKSIMIKNKKTIIWPEDPGTEVIREKTDEKILIRFSSTVPLLTQAEYKKQLYWSEYIYWSQETGMCIWL